MKKLAIMFFVGAAALFGGSAALLRTNTGTAKPNRRKSNLNDISSRGSSLSPLWLSSLPELRLLSAAVLRRRLRSAVLWRRLWRVGLTMAVGYGYGGPGVTFSFGGGGYAAGKHKSPQQCGFFLWWYEAPWFSAVNGLGNRRSIQLSYGTRTRKERRAKRRLNSQSRPLSASVRPASATGLAWLGAELSTSFATRQVGCRTGAMGRRRLVLFRKRHRSELLELCHDVRSEIALRSASLTPR